MNEEAAFRAAIQAARTNNTPRLIYLDWLEGSCLESVVVHRMIHRNQ